MSTSQSATIIKPKPLGRYDSWNPVNNNGPVPYVDPTIRGPAHVHAKPYDPADHPLDRHYLGSRKLRSSEDPTLVAVREFLDMDARRIGYKVWFREIFFMQTGLITSGRREKQVKRTLEEFLRDTTSSATLVPPPLVHTSSSDSFTTVGPTTPETEDIAVSTDPFADAFCQGKKT